MRRLLSGVLLGAVGVGSVLLLGADWASQSGNPQRDGWAQGETELVKANVPEIRLLYKTKLDNQSRGMTSLTSPIIVGNLITYLGFKEMMFLGGSSDNVYSIDAALNRPLWKAHFDYKGKKPQASPTSDCSGGMTASVAVLGGSGRTQTSFHRFRKRAAAPGGGPGVGPNQGGAARVPKPTPDNPASTTGSLFSTGFGANGYVFAIGSDGYLRFVRQSDGNDKAVTPVKFLPANTKASAININGTSVYAATVDGCAGNPNALYAIDLGGADRSVVSFRTNGSGLSGTGGTAISSVGTVYAQVNSGHGEVAGDYHDTVVALDPKNLTVKDYFTPSDPGSAMKKGSTGVTPTVFEWKGKDVIVAAGTNGTVYLLDGESLGGRDHHTPLSQTDPIADASEAGRSDGISGNFSTWEDADTNTRWVYAALWGALSEKAKFPMENGTATDGSIVAFKVEDRNGHPTLVPQWISGDLKAPASPITTNGLVFALSTGQPPQQNTDHATMYILDGTTGKTLFSTHDEVTASADGSGLALANGRVYFTTHDNTVYCYGLPSMQPQLTER